MNLRIVLGASCGALLGAHLTAAPNIDPANATAYGANIGWTHWRPGTTNGATLGEQFLTGQIWSANCGWISLGDGSPANGYRYLNNSGSDFGVNVEPDGSLSGLAYGANIGWITFTNRSAAGPLASAERPRVNLTTGRFAGYAYSANCGWISLATDVSQLKALGVDPGPDVDGDGIPDAWEQQHVGNLTSLTAQGDFDHDGVADRDEYRADSDPANPADNLRLTGVQASGGGANVALTWRSSPRRSYLVEKRDVLGDAGAWAPVSATPIPGSAAATTSSIVTSPPQAQQYFRIQSLRPGVDTAF